jgi:hypothetical protein
VANGGAAVKYCLVLSAGSVSESDDVLEAPLELVAECMYLVLDFQWLLDKKPVSLEERVEASEDGLEAALENDYAFGTHKVDEVQNGTTGRDVRRNALEKRTWWERVADASSKLASRQRGRRLFDARKKGVAGDRIRSVEDCSRRIDVDVVVVEVVVRVVRDEVAGGVVRTLLTAASLGAAVLTVSLLSKRLLGVCWARR